RRARRAGGRAGRGQEPGLRAGDQLRPALRRARRAGRGQPGLHEAADRPAPTLPSTGRPIAPPPDNPYRAPVPTIQLLHCLHAATGGGDSTFTDGFRAAAVLRERDPAAFTCLTTTPVTFAYADAATVLRATGPMIGLDPRGRIRQIRLNGRSLAPVRLPAARGRAFSPAYRAFPVPPPGSGGVGPTTGAPGVWRLFQHPRV